MRRAVVAVGAVLALGLLLFLLLHDRSAPWSGASGEPAAPAAATPDADSAPSFAAEAPSAPPPTPILAEQSGCRVHVADARGAPIAGVPVDAVWPVSPEEDGTAHATTDAAGRALIACRTGPCSVAVNGRGIVPAWGACYRDLVVPAGAPLDVEVTLAEAHSRLDVFVHDERGAGVADASVRASGPPGATNSDTRKTDDHGLATWDGIVAGTWSVCLAGVPDRIDPMEASTVTVEVGVAASASLQIGVQVKATLHVELPDGAVVAQLASVSVAEARRTQVERGPFKQRVLDWLVTPGDCVLSADWTAGSASWSRPQVLSLQASEERTVTLRYEPGVAGLTGRVVDDRGTPVAGVHVSTLVLRGPGGPPVVNPAETILARKEAISDATGAWTLSGLPAGEAVLTVSASAFSARPRYFAETWGPGEHLDLVAGVQQVPDLVVEPGVFLSLHVPEPWLAKCRDNDLTIEIVRSGPAAVPGERARRARSGTEDVFGLAHCSTGALSARLVGKDHEVVATAALTVDPNAAEGSTVELTPDFRP